MPAMLRRLARVILNVLTALSLVLCVAACVLRLTTTSSQTGVTFGAPGGRFVVLKGADARGYVVVNHGWPTREPFRAFWRDDYIGTSGTAAGPMSIWTSPRFGLFFERGHSYVYVGGDGRTPLQGRAALSSSSNPSPSPTPFWLLYFPLTLLIMATAALPAAAGLAALLRRARHRRARAASRCVNCGYDLRATPGRCPECGTVPAG